MGSEERRVGGKSWDRKMGTHNGLNKRPYSNKTEDRNHIQHCSDLCKCCMAHLFLYSHTCMKYYA